MRPTKPTDPTQLSDAPGVELPEVARRVAAKRPQLWALMWIWDVTDGNTAPPT